MTLASFCSSWRRLTQNRGVWAFELTDPTAPQRRIDNLTGFARALTVLFQAGLYRFDTESVRATDPLAAEQMLASFRGDADANGAVVAGRRESPGAAADGEATDAQAAARPAKEIAPMEGMPRAARLAESIEGLGLVTVTEALRRLELGAREAAASSLVGAFWGMASVFAQSLALDEARIAALLGAAILDGAMLQWPKGHPSDTCDRRSVLSCGPPRDRRHRAVAGVRAARRSFWPDPGRGHVRHPGVRLLRDQRGTRQRPPRTQPGAGSHEWPAADSRDRRPVRTAARRHRHEARRPHRAARGFVRHRGGPVHFRDGSRDAAACAAT